MDDAPLVHMNGVCNYRYFASSLLKLCVCTCIPALNAGAFELLLTSLLECSQRLLHACDLVDRKWHSH